MIGIVVYKVMKISQQTLIEPILNRDCKSITAQSAISYVMMN